MLVFVLVLERSFKFRQGRNGLLQEGISGDVIRFTLPLESIERCVIFEHEHEHEHDYEIKRRANNDTPEAGEQPLTTDRPRATLLCNHFRKGVAMKRIHCNWYWYFTTVIPRLAWVTLAG